MDRVMNFKLALKIYKDWYNDNAYKKRTQKLSIDAEEDIEEFCKWLDSETDSKFTMEIII
jgi:hypothetical protein